MKIHRGFLGSISGVQNQAPDDLCSQGVDRTLSSCLCRRGDSFSGGRNTHGQPQTLNATEAETYRNWKGSGAEVKRPRRSCVSRSRSKNSESSPIWRSGTSGWWAPGAYLSTGLVAHLNRVQGTQDHCSGLQNTRANSAPISTQHCSRPGVRLQLVFRGKAIGRTRRKDADLGRGQAREIHFHVARSQGLCLVRVGV